MAARRLQGEPCPGLFATVGAVLVARQTCLSGDRPDIDSSEVVAPGAALARVFDPDNLMIRFQVPRDRRREVSAGTAVELTVAGADRPLRAHVTSVSSDLEPPLDFAVAEADIVEAVAARDVQFGTLGDVRVVAAK